MITQLLILLKLKVIKVVTFVNLLVEMFVQFGDHLSSTCCATIAGQNVNLYSYTGSQVDFGKENDIVV
jgi:hypothetical protein